MAAAREGPLVAGLAWFGLPGRGGAGSDSEDEACCAGLGWVTFCADFACTGLAAPVACAVRTSVRERVNCASASSQFCISRPGILPLFSKIA